MNQQHQIRLALAQRQRLRTGSQRRLGAIAPDPHVSGIDGPAQPVLAAPADLHDESAAEVDRPQVQLLRLGAQIPMKIRASGGVVTHIQEIVIHSAATQTDTKT